MAPPFKHDGVNASQVTYTCTGTIVNFACEPGKSPITPGNITKDIREFTVGFAEGLGHGLGFDDCIEDLRAFYNDVVTMVHHFKTGINQKLKQVVVEAFKVVSSIVKMVAACAVATAKLWEKFTNLARALAGDVLAIIEIAMHESLHIYHNRKELTDDAKAIVADWQAGDFQGSGYALGDIVGDLIHGLSAQSSLANETIVV